MSFLKVFEQGASLKNMHDVERFYLGRALPYHSGCALKVT
jgi:hypothetical protein